MAKVFTINSDKGEADELKRLAAFTQLDELDTEVLERLTELSKDHVAVGFLKTSFQFALLKGALKKFKK